LLACSKKLRMGGATFQKSCPGGRSGGERGITHNGGPTRRPRTDSASPRYGLLPTHTLGGVGVFSLFQVYHDHDHVVIKPEVEALQALSVSLRGSAARRVVTAWCTYRPTFIRCLSINTPPPTWAVPMSGVLARAPYDLEQCPQSRWCEPERGPPDF